MPYITCLILAVASSLTELFSPNIIAERVQGMLKRAPTRTSGRK
jgi:hypothetical protein